MRRALAVILFGLLFGQFIGWIHSQGYFTHWSRVDPAPVSLSALIRTDELTLYVQAADGIIYGCTAWKPPCWFRVTSSLPPARSEITHIKPCSQIGPAFSITTAPPNHVRDCVAGRVVYADGYGDYLFALGADQSVWYWQSVHSAYDHTLRIFPVVGAITGGFLYGSIWAIRRNKQTLLREQSK